MKYSRDLEDLVNLFSTKLISNEIGFESAVSRMPDQFVCSYRETGPAQVAPPFFHGTRKPIGHPLIRTGSVTVPNAATRTVTEPVRNMCPDEETGIFFFVDYICLYHFTYFEGGART